MQKKKKSVRILAGIVVWSLLLSCLAGAFPTTTYAAGGSTTGGTSNDDWVSIPEGDDGPESYFYYIKEYANAARPEKEISVDVTKFDLIDPEFGYDDEKTQVYTNREGSKKGVYVVANTEEVIFRVKVPETGLYSIEMKYFALATSNSKILCDVKLDGETPFNEAATCILSRTYVNGEITKDEDGDDLRPKSTQIEMWRSQYLSDQTGVNGVLSFYLTKGEHELSISLDGTPILLEAITLKQQPYIVSYQDYLSLGKQNGLTASQNISKQYEAEHYYQQSSSTLWPSYDRTSPLTQPFDYDHIRINYGGGSQWKEPGQWISWTIDVPEDGYYNIGMKYRQTYLDGLFCSRKLLVDGEVLFSELQNIRYEYTTQWKNKILGDGNNAYSIYLTKGEHVITLENTVGELQEAISVLQTVNANLNDLYLQIIMITSSEPDQYRDYYLERQLPELSNDLKANAKMLFEEAALLAEIVGARGAETAFFENIAYNLETYAGNIVDLTYKNRLNNLKNDINSLSAKCTAYQEQALDIDYIMLLSPGKQMPKATPNFFQSLVYQIKMFFASFRKDRDNEKEGAVKVWINTGNDQLNIIESMITDLFEPQYGIDIDLELVQGTLIEATVAGNGPDVALNIAADTVVNLAMRGALTDLSQFDSYWDVVDEYFEGAETPFVLEGKYYGVPNSCGFSMMFVRTDIFEKLGLSVPDTWDDVYDVAQVLQRNNMVLGCVPSFAMLLYQKGGSYFDEGLTKVLFDSDVAVEALTQHTEFYTKYGFPIEYDFTSRFRTGEMPIGISSYATYNTLKYSAPEIANCWQMFRVPGTVREDGTVDYTQMEQTGTGTIMFSRADNKEAAWKFIEWWSSAEAQTRYANDLEAVMGVAARYQTQNIETLHNIDWSTAELKVLEQQIEHLKFIPIVPGNYYVGRGLTNATRGVIYDGENPRELLEKWTIQINDEITRKREEFNMNN